jgi:EAL domain-containing protein (putative c-di-GMP-specific phosphodiesterase class I)
MPDIAKLDMSLVRGIDQDPRLKTIVRSMNKLCDELSILVISEGVETPAERDELERLGCGLHQGYLYARPQRGFPEPRW